jgi:hypothetical protein
MPRRCRRSRDRKRTGAANRCACRRRERPRLSAAGLFSDNVSAGRWSVARSREHIRFFRTPSNHTSSGRRPRVAFIVAPPCRADRSCHYAGLGAVDGGDGDRAPIERRPPLRVWERRIAGHARKTTTRMESSKDSDCLIGGAPYRADRAHLDRRSPPSVGSCPAAIARPTCMTVTQADIYVSRVRS